MGQHSTNTIMKKLLLLLLIITGLQTVAPAQLNYVYNKRLTEVFDSVCNQFNIKGASAAIIVPGEGKWERAYGYSHANVPITKDMYLGIGSNTKTFYAALMLKLQEQGKLDLDDTIGKWITNKPNIPGNITIRQLLNHTSGLYSYTDNNDLNTYILADYTKVWPPDSIFNLVKAPKAAPGGAWDYCNTNYALAGMIAASVTGKSAQQALRDEILTPAGLNETFFYPYETPNGTIPHAWSSNLNTGNNMEDLIVAHNYSHNAMFSLAYSAGAIMSTARDNALFWDKLMHGQIINSSSLAEMETLVSIGSGNGYGLGIFTFNNFNGRKVVSHGGTNIGFINDNIHDKSNGVTITILTNQDSVANGYILGSFIMALHKVTIQYTDVEDITNKEQQAVIYPNPAKGQLHVNATAAANLKMYSITGQQVKSSTLNKGDNTIELHNINSGTYYIDIRDSEKPVHRQTIQIIQ